MYTGKITTLQFSGQYILHEAGRRTVWTEPPEDCTLFHEAVHQKLLKPAHPRQLVFEHCLCSLAPSSDTVVCAFTRATGRQECPSQGEVGGGSSTIQLCLRGSLKQYTIAQRGLVLPQVTKMLHDLRWKTHGKWRLRVKYR